MRLAYFSPFSPQRSGIADYSEELLPHLAAQGAQCDLFVDGFEPTNAEMRALCFAEDLAESRQMIEERGLKVVNATPFVVPYYSTGNRIEMYLLEVQRAQP